jgi:RNA polymerase sigma-70 factor (ECF subfamily)
VTPALLRRARAGEWDARDALFDRFGKVVFDTAYRLTKNRDDAQDVVQEVFLGLPGALGSYEGRGSFEGWLRRVAARRALMLLRSRRQKREVSIDIETAPRVGGAVPPDRVEDRVAIEEGIASLKDGQRIVFVLKEIEGYSHREIAKLLSITVLASRSRYHRALKRLREFLEDSS